MRLFSFPLSKQKRFEQRLSPYLTQIFQRAYQLTQSQHDAEELLQDLLLKLYEKQDVWETVEDLKPWVMKTLYHLFIDEWRRKRNHTTEEFDEEIIPTLATLQSPLNSEPDTNADQEQFYRHLQTAINTLTTEQRTLILLHDVEGYTLTEIHHELSVPIGTLKSRLHRARENVRNKLKNTEPFCKQSRSSHQQDTICGVEAQ